MAKINALLVVEKIKSIGLGRWVKSTSDLDSLS